jgi:transcriptional regulator with XRE-family HTH domain
MGHLERGEKNVSFRSLMRVAEALSVTLSELFAGLEGDEEGTAGMIGTGDRPPGGQKNPTGLDRKRVLQELKALERVTANLREIVQTPLARPRPIRAKKT